MLQAEPRPVPTKHHPSSHFPRTGEGVAVVGEGLIPCYGWSSLPSLLFPWPRTASWAALGWTLSATPLGQPRPGSTSDDISERALGV